MNDELDSVALVFILLCLAALAVYFVLRALVQDQKRRERRNRYRSDVLPAPQRDAVGPRHFADT